MYMSGIDFILKVQADVNSKNHDNIHVHSCSRFLDLRFSLQADVESKTMARCTWIILNCRLRVHIWDVHNYVSFRISSDCRTSSFFITHISLFMYPLTSYKNKWLDIEYQQY